MALRRRAALAAIAAALSVRAVPAAAELTTIRVQTVATDNATPLVYGAQAGLFAGAGIELRIEKAASGAAIAAAVIAGAFEIGLSSFVAIINAHARGIPLVFLAPAGVYRSKTEVASDNRTGR